MLAKFNQWPPPDGHFSGRLAWLVQASATAVTDCVVPDGHARLAALVAAINASTAPRVRAVIGPDDYLVPSAALAARPLRITRSNVAIEGIDRPRIVVTGNNVTSSVFASDGCSDVAYRGISFVGNNRADRYANGVAIAHTNRGASDIRGLTVEDCDFAGFQGDYWVWVEVLGTRSIEAVRITGNRFVSASGNARGPGDIRINSAFVGIIGNSAAETSAVRDVQVQDNRMEADFIKTGVQIFHNVRDFVVEGNVIRHAGQREVQDDCGAYAIMVYESAGTSRGGRGRVARNRIVAPRSCGIYQANRFEGTVYLDNDIDGQTDTRAATLPKGGIVLNGGAAVTVRGGSIVDCAADGIFWIPPSDAPSDARILIDGVALGSCRASGIELQSAVRDSRNVEVRGCRIDGCRAGILLKMFASALLSDVRLQANEIRSSLPGSVGIQVASDDGSNRLSGLAIRGGTIATRGTGIVAAHVTAGPVEIGGGIRLEGPFSDGGLNLAASTQLMVDGVDFVRQTAGPGLRTAGARGTLRNIAFSTDSDPARRLENSGSEDLGRAMPRWVPTAGATVVQDILATPPGQRGTAGWVYDPAAAPGWRDVRGAGR
jgi:hypothetical protein